MCATRFNINKLYVLPTKLIYFGVIVKWKLIPPPQ